jgi:phosphoribosyl 1,2-cyclic phosphodiesterase
MEIETATGQTLIVDAGTGIRNLGNRLSAQVDRELHLLFTHAHWDHIIGFPFFKPLFSHKAALVLHSGPFTVKGIQRVLSHTMSAPYFPVAFKDIKARIEYQDTPASPFRIGGLTIEPIPISHPNNGYGYKFMENGKTFIFLTDNELGYTHPRGLSPEAYAEFSACADLLIHDAEFTPEEYEKTVGWGHSVYTDVLRLAEKADVKQLGLFHLNQDRTDEEMDRLVEKACPQIRGSIHPHSFLAVGRGMRFVL